MNVAFGEPTIAVDTHIFRVCNRTSLAPGRNPLEVEMALEATVPAKFKLHAHHWLILHGRYTCVARLPRCPECVVADLCRYKAKTLLSPDGVLVAPRSGASAARTSPKRGL
jgi:endonuclease-3